MSQCCWIFVFSILTLLKVLQQCRGAQSPKGGFCYLPRQQTLNRSFPWITLTFVYLSGIVHAVSPVMEGNFKGGRGKKKDTEAFEAAVNKRARVHVLWDGDHLIPNQSKNIGPVQLNMCDHKDRRSTGLSRQFFFFFIIACLYPAVLCVCPLSCAPPRRSCRFISENSGFVSQLHGRLGRLLTAAWLWWTDCM